MTKPNQPSTFSPETAATIRESGWVVAQLMKIVLADPRKFFHADGTPKKVYELGDNEAAALSSFDIDGVGKVVDRLEAIELLGCYLGLWSQQPANDVGPFEAMSLDELRRVRDWADRLLAGAGEDPPPSAPRRRDM